MALELLSEALMLGLAGGALGVVFAQAGIGLLRRMAPVALPRVDEIGPDAVVLLVTLIISVVTSGPNGMEGQSNCRTLEELLDSLDPDLFWRAHRSYLVNINRIKEVVPWFKSSYQLRMDDKKQTEIPVSRAQTKRLRELFGL